MFSTYEITDLTKISDEQGIVLRRFLRENIVINKNDPQQMSRVENPRYVFPQLNKKDLAKLSPDFKSKEYTFIKIPDEIVWRQSNNNREGYCYAVLGNMAHEGSFGILKEIKAELHLKKGGGLFVKKLQHPYLIKILNGLDQMKSVSPKDWLESEYRFMRKTFYLHPKAPVLFSSREGYIVMRQLKGGDLHTQWSTDPAIQVCIEYSRNLLRELSYLHAANIIHRDLKLENVLLENKDETTLKIADFGFSKMKSPKLDASVCGTDEYMAPEVLKNISNEKSDLFAVGMIILRLLSDRIKLTEADDFLAGKIKNYKVHKILYANGKGNGASKTSRLCAIPLDQQEALEKLVKKLINRDPEQRLTLMQAWEEIENIRLMNTFTGMSISEQEEIKKTQTAALTLQQKLLEQIPKIDGDPELFYFSLAHIKKLFVDGMKTLDDNKKSIEKFLDIIGIEALNSCKNKQEIQSTLDTIIDGYIDQVQTLKEMQEKIKNQLDIAEEEKDEIAKHKLVKRFNHLLRMVNANLSLHRDVTHHIDNLVQLSKKFAKVPKKISAALNLLEENEKKIPSLASIGLFKKVSNEMQELHHAYQFKP